MTALVGKHVHFEDGTSPHTPSPPNTPSPPHTPTPPSEGSPRLKADEVRMQIFNKFYSLGYVEIYEGLTSHNIEEIKVINPSLFNLIETISKILKNFEFFTKAILESDCIPVKDTSDITPFLNITDIIYSYAVEVDADMNPTPLKDPETLVDCINLVHTPYQFFASRAYFPLNKTTIGERNFTEDNYKEGLEQPIEINPFRPYASFLDSFCSRDEDNMQRVLFSEQNSVGKGATQKQYCCFFLNSSRYYFACVPYVLEKEESSDFSSRAITRAKTKTETRAATKAIQIHNFFLKGISWADFCKMPKPKRLSIVGKA